MFGTALEVKDFRPDAPRLHAVRLQELSDWGKNYGKELALGFPHLLRHFAPCAFSRRGAKGGNLRRASVVGGQSWPGTDTIARSGFRQTNQVEN